MMPKQKNTAVLVCDICDFKATNAYIFKRHMHKCLSLHGIASKRSSPRNPIRLKGTEGLLSKEASVEDSSSDWSQGTGDETRADASHAENADIDVSGVKMESTQAEGKTETAEISQDEVNVSVLTSESETPGIEKSAEEDRSLPGAPYSRQYNCNECLYQGTSARDYLYHLRDEHGHKYRIYECKICDYATRYGNKLERHMSVHNKLVINMDDRGRRERASLRLAEERFASAAAMDSENPKVQPLKLKRLNIRMPFKVSEDARLSPGGSSTSSKRSSRNPQMCQISPNGQNSSEGRREKEVYRMVLAEDGSHYYQCRDCLYYASIPSNVKKHHGLCHTKMLCCPHCSLTTMSQGIYYEHLVTHEGYGYVKCPDCSYVTSAKSNYEKHRSFHVGEFPAQCTVCNFGAESESKIKRHVATQHVPDHDPGRKRTWSEGGDMDGALNSEDEEMGGEADQQEDMDDASSGPTGDTKGTETGDEYRCHKCPMVCFRRGNFTRHLMAKHNYTADSAGALSKSMENQIFRGLKRKRKTSNVAFKKMRLLSSENRKCSHCSYIAKWPSDLRRHMQVHTIVKRFKCSMCVNKYKYLGDLNVHMRRDHNMEPPENITKELTTLDGGKKASPAVFRCPSCPFATHYKAHLEQHSRTHGNMDKTYVCRLCSYQTYWRGDVGRHLYRHHQIILSKDATEIGDYFLHRPEIKPTTKQGTPIRNGSDLPEGTKASESGMENILEQSDNARASSTPAPVNLKDGNFICEYPDCEFKTTISDRMESHIAVHLNLKQFVCPTCGKRTNWKWDVVKHMNKVHQNTTAAVEDVITLSVDEAKATISDYLMNVEKKSKELSVSYCSLCNFQSIERNRVVRHMGSVHKNENGRVINKVMSSPEEFQMMQKAEREMNQSNDNEQRDMDVSEDSGVPKFVTPPPEELAKYEKPFACALCKKPGTSKGDVKKHYNYTHPYKEVRVIYVGDGTEFNYYSGEIYQRSSRSETPDSSESKPGLPPLSSFAKLQKMESKFSNPKMHGYVKPFKCSICGLRSNWKWDLKKHLRSKHPTEGGFVIMLSIEEASKSYGKDCTPSHPKNEDYLSVPKTSPSPVPSLSSPNHSSLSVFKLPPSIKAEALDSSSSRDSFSSSFFPKSPASSMSPSPSPRGRDRSTFFDPMRRQWKCSGCNYISNWRRNMARHIHRKHPGEEHKVKVIPLHKESPESIYKMMDTFAGQNDATLDVESSDGLYYVEPNERKSTLPGEGRLWRCPECTWTSRLRTHIILHMQGHEMKPFTCGVCNLPFKNRGPLHRHLQKVHKRSDYIKLCKVNIRYDDEDVITNDSRREEYVNSYFCRLCNLESDRKDEIIVHLTEVHNTVESDNILKIQKLCGGNFQMKSLPPGYGKPDSQRMFSRKFHFCTICPYRSQKKSMLAFHMTYHKPNPANRFKCKFCPYYVSTLRLLHQHQRKWHQEMGGGGAGKMSRELEKQMSQPVTPVKLYHSPSSPASTPRRHCCEKCPYTTNSKNDFIYHKQFHRPKRTAEFKCEYCDYWVVHKRLLKQHMRLHSKAGSPESGADTSPAKSLYSVCPSTDPGLVYDPAELTQLAAIKQKMISAKITASLSKSPTISPMKIASQCAVDDKPNFVMKNGLYRKLHKCRFCPYTNIRARNMQLHEMMHGPRESPHQLMKCPYCDYYVGSKGLLSHHMKVHQKNYGDTPENDTEAEMAELMEDNDNDFDEEILPQQKVDTLLQISRFKRFGCEKCPYASAKRQHFERHLELHGSRQRYTCQYCDYSVPSSTLLLQHTKLHMMPNQNLLASQSITNLQHLSEVPADVALASALPPADSETTVTISVIHDHLGLYENSIYDSEPKKLYRCDRCPYANVRRDYLLSHLKFHMVPSALVCPYCDYSAPKQPLLTQHIRVHFCPLPELSDWLLENGQTERETSQRNIDLAEALKVAHEYQNQFKKKEKNKATDDKVAGGKEEKAEGKENIQSTSPEDAPHTYICQYCDREFMASDKLVKHELQHLIGNNFETSMQILSAQQSWRQQQQPRNTQTKVNHSSGRPKREVVREREAIAVADSWGQPGIIKGDNNPAQKERVTDDSVSVSLELESVGKNIDTDEEDKEQIIDENVKEEMRDDKINDDSSKKEEEMDVVEDDKDKIDDADLVDLTHSPETDISEGDHGGTEDSSAKVKEDRTSDLTEEVMEVDGPKKAMTENSDDTVDEKTENEIQKEEHKTDKEKEEEKEHTEGKDKMNNEKIVEEERIRKEQINQNEGVKEIESEIVKEENNEKLGALEGRDNSIEKTNDEQLEEKAHESSSQTEKAEDKVDRESGTCEPKKCEENMESDNVAEQPSPSELDKNDEKPVADGRDGIEGGGIEILDENDDTKKTEENPVDDGTDNVEKTERELESNKETDIENGSSEKTVEEIPNDNDSVGKAEKESNVGETKGEIESEADAIEKMQPEIDNKDDISVKSEKQVSVDSDSNNTDINHDDASDSIDQSSQDVTGDSANEVPPKEQTDETTTEAMEVKAESAEKSKSMDVDNNAETEQRITDTKSDDEVEKGQRDEPEKMLVDQGSDAKAPDGENIAEVTEISGAEVGRPSTDISQSSEPDSDILDDVKLLEDDDNTLIDRETESATKMGDDLLDDDELLADVKDEKKRENISSDGMEHKNHAVEMKKEIGDP